MRPLIRTAWVLVALHAGFANAAPRTVYEGTLQGAGAVVMELDNRPAADGSISGRYFYAQHGVDIPLHGTPAELIEPLVRTQLPDEARSPLEFGEQADFDHAAATWHGTRDKGGYRGQWTDARTGKTRSFTLRRMAEYDPDAVAPGSVEAVTNSIAGGVGSGIASGVAIDMRQTPYATLKLAGHAQPAGPEIGSSTVAYRMWHDPRTRLMYPRLSRHPDPAVMARVNRLLEQQHWQMNLAALECASTRYTDDGPAAGSLGNYDDEQVTVTWLSPAALGIVESGSTYCGGAHPNNHYDPVTFDLLRGTYLDWNRVIDATRVGKDGDPGTSPAMVSFITRLRDKATQGEQVTDGEGDSMACADVFPQYLAFEFDAPGKLSFVVSGIGHAMGACLGPQLDAPFAALAPILKPGGSRYLVPGVKLK
ncbi:TPA: hypothetical protein QDC20_001700 [Burkholderia aenigmatica]|uniref:hypothetical protein n=1 Tax=Burkholderia sp. AU45251 TaxID=3059204 RepID=UPI00264DC5E3|nr:hypothetical protein [Burkholderia sp. AU45251]HDR9485238.1 hypothetical protein [Burkholderia aenigmatica]MDN7515524.1 hypothetical protein [Burkholderia sp. AU45251]HDR9516785.1 hypothetical protein [Burkholderia aenigmatica]HDR9593845.1 hypothetical protein [Burkholderia aenigmatica]HDR9602151.1 hypothetical protein [Burkholderia aenigmatica]